MASSTNIGSCIIVGGGPGGVAVARGLQKQLGTKKTMHVTIVDRHDYLDWTVASPRSLVAPDDVSKVGYAMPLDKVCEHLNGKTENIKSVQGAATSIGPQSVTLLPNGQTKTTTLEADVVVVAIGGQYADGAIWKATPEQTTAELRVAGFRQKLAEVEKAQNIVVAGAGLAGVEVAGEIQSAFPDKTVTIVGSSFMPMVTATNRAGVRQALEGLGVVVKEGGHVDMASWNANQKKVTMTKTGESLDCDLLLNAAGYVYAGVGLTENCASSSAGLKDSVTDRGQFKCRPTLQLEGCDSVFAVGDIVAVPPGSYADIKGVLHAEMTGTTVANNIVKFLSSNGAKLDAFKWAQAPVQTPVMSAMGPTTGVADMGLPYCMSGLGNALCRSLKCKDYYMSIQGGNFGKGKTW